mmetsp:Transcript_34675/g.69034  ORF Transcript_34675/g.69034 Transcript_34675/m.69034 type:complete len:251 (+) Transcript_34675:1-753(+)
MNFSALSTRLMIAHWTRNSALVASRIRLRQSRHRFGSRRCSGGRLGFGFGHGLLDRSGQEGETGLRVIWFLWRDGLAMDAVHVLMHCHLLLLLAVLRALLALDLDSARPCYVQRMGTAVIHHAQLEFDRLALLERSEPFLVQLSLVNVDVIAPVVAGAVRPDESKALGIPLYAFSLRTFDRLLSLLRLILCCPRRQWFIIRDWHSGSQRHRDSHVLLHLSHRAYVVGIFVNYRSIIFVVGHMLCCFRRGS